MEHASVGIPKIEDAVEAGFEMVRNLPWARKFLLESWDNDPCGDVAALSNPVAFGHSESQHVRIVAALPPIAVLSADARQSAMTSASPVVANNIGFFWLPAWSQDDLTVGIVVQRTVPVEHLSSIDTLPNPGEAGTLAIGRFARVNSTGETLMISKVPRSSSSLGGRPMVAVTYLRNVSTVKREHLFMHCDYALLSKSEQVPLSFARSVVFAERSIANRRCCVCEEEPLAEKPCACVMKFSPPARSLDFTSFRANGKCNYGQFTAVSTVYVRPPTASYLGVRSMSSLVTTTELPGARGESISSTLQTLAIQERSKHVAVVSCPLFNGAKALLSATREQSNDSHHVPRVQPGAANHTATFADAELTHDFGSMAEVASRQWILESPDANPGSGVLDSGLPSPLDSQDFLQDPVPQLIDVPTKVPRRLTVDDLERARASAKAERQMRNRLSAAKSNQKRRDHRDALRTLLKEAREKEAQLRNIHATLSARNAVLKECLRSSNQ